MFEPPTHAELTASDVRAAERKAASLEARVAKLEQDTAQLKRLLMNLLIALGPRGDGS